METTIREILKEHMPSKELRQRLNNKQIKLNNEVVTDLNQVLNIHKGASWDLGDFIFFQIGNRLKGITFFGNIRDWFGNFETNVPRFQFLGAYDLLEFSKKDAIVLLKDPSGPFTVTEIPEDLEIEPGATIILPLEILYYINELNYWPIEDEEDEDDTM